VDFAQIEPNITIVDIAHAIESVVLGIEDIKPNITIVDIAHAIESVVLGIEDIL
jgi:2-keto-4-pentenoate hydratase